MKRNDLADGFAALNAQTKVKIEQSKKDIIRDNEAGLKEKKKELIKYFKEVHANEFKNSPELYHLGMEIVSRIGSLKHNFDEKIMGYSGDVNIGIAAQIKSDLAADIDKRFREYAQILQRMRNEQGEKKFRIREKTWIPLINSIIPLLVAIIGTIAAYYLNKSKIDDLQGRVKTIEDKMKFSEINEAKP
jgi:hypothetical protein